MLTDMVNEGQGMWWTDGNELDRGECDADPAFADPIRLSHFEIALALLTLSAHYVAR